LSTSTIPNDEACLRILEQEGCKPSVIQHVCNVQMIAVAMAERSGAEIELVRAGALLHDVGRARTQGIMHVPEGVRIARERHLPENLVMLIQRHVAAGLTSAEAVALGLPPGDYVPRSLEEKIVCHADNLVKGSEGIQTLADAMAEMVRRGHRVTAERMQAMHAELSQACGTDIDDLVREVKSRPRVKGPCAGHTSRPDVRL
jgi:uncharacterized protein (TIGR00295 family)